MARPSRKKRPVAQTEARKELLELVDGKRPKLLKLAMAILVTSYGVRKIVYAEVERGDGEGTGEVRRFVDEARLLLPNDKQYLFCIVANVDLDGLESVASHVKVFDLEEGSK